MRQGGVASIPALWRARWRACRWPLLVLPLAVAVVLAIRSGVVREPLTSKDILVKQSWSEAELIRALGRVFAPQSNRQDRAEVVQHLRGQLHRYPAAEQEQIRMRAMAFSASESLRQFRTMPPADRQAFLEALQIRAERSYAQVRKLPPQDRAAIRKRLESEGGQELSREINRILHREFTDAERSEFAPVTKIWVQTLQEVR